jgi:pseudaminic acid cytidylyltransferase
MKLAVIPARGGSKRIPRKNVREFCGQPMLSWSIQAARESGCFERIVVSTDCADVAAVAREWGAEVPFERPAELSDDHTGTLPVIAHAVRACGLGEADLACCLYATAPFVRPEDLRAGLAALNDPEVVYAFSVTAFTYPIQRALRIVDGGGLRMFDPRLFEVRSQDLEEAYHDAGQFYWGRASAWSAQAPLFAEHSRPVHLPTHRVQDIDTEADWERAEWLFRAMRAREDADE